MSLIGYSCMILSANNAWRMAVIRAASQPLLPNSDLTQIRVLLEWCEGGGVTEGQREWVNLTNPELFKTVYVEKKLLWAKRILASDQNRAVAWPARAFTYLCGTPVQPSMDMMIVEYFCDKEKAELHCQETKELQLSEAKATLSQQAQMIQELNEWEEVDISRKLLHYCSVPLSGCRVSVCNVQQPGSWISGIVTSHNLQTKELTLMEEHTQSLQTVNPLMAQVLLHSFPNNGNMGVSSHEHQNGMWHTPTVLSLVNSSDGTTSTNNTAPVINSPHNMTSPVIQECQSPRFNLNLTNKSCYQSPARETPPTHTPLHTPVNGSFNGPHSNDPLNAPLTSYRRSSLQNHSLMRSEPNLHRRSSLDPATLHHLADPFNNGFLQPDHAHSHSLGKIPFHSSSPTDGNVVLPHLRSSPHGSNTRLNRHCSSNPRIDNIHSSNPQLNTTHGSGTLINHHGSSSQLSHHGSNSQLSFHGSSPQLSHHGSTSQLSHHSSNSSLNGDRNGMSFPTPEDIIKQTDRSKSLGNIFSCVQTQPLGQCYQQEQPAHVGGGGGLRRHPTPSGNQVPGKGALPMQSSQNRRKNSFGSGLGKSGIKKPRFEVLPTISDPHIDAKGEERLAMAVSKALSRSASHPVVFPSNKVLEKRLKQLSTGGNGSQKPEDDLDIIKQIIEKDVSMTSAESADEGVDTLRSQSLSHISGQFLQTAGSLPSLPHAESMHILHANYNSAPDFMQFGKTHLTNFDGMHLGIPEGGGEHILSPDSQQQNPFPGGCIQPGIGSASAQEASMGVPDGKSLSRRNSLYESHSVVGTPVLTANSAQNTPQGGGPPFDFTHHRNSHLPGYSDLGNGEERNPPLGAGAVKKWNGQPNTGALNMFQYVNATDEKGVESEVPSSAEAVLQKLKNEDRSPTQLLCDYLVGGSMETERSGPSKGEEEMGEEVVGGKSRHSRAGDPELNLPLKAADVATEAVILAPSLIMGEQEGESVTPGLEEFSISKVVNTQFSSGDLGAEDLMYDMEDGRGLTPLSPAATVEVAPSKKKKPKKPKKAPAVKENCRSRGRPRLSEVEKERRKELRELGLMKRSKRRTKEQVAQWKAEKTMSPAKRGRKPGSGKKNIIKTATGKVVFVSVDLSQYQNGTVLLQNGFCRAYPGVSKCLDCGTCDGDFPSSKYCRFLEFRKLRVDGIEDRRVSVHGFADYNDVSTQDLVPWTPLRTSGSRMDHGTALYILNQIIPEFITIVTEEAKTLPDHDVLPIWKRVVSGVRELCDTCDTSLFNFHWVCPSCGFCVCPACYSVAFNSGDRMEEVSSMEGSLWPPCVCNGQPHQPSGLIVAQIIPANILSDVLSQVIAVCEAHHIQVSLPGVLQKLTAVLEREIPHQKYQNEPAKKSKVQKTTTPTTAQLLSCTVANSDPRPSDLLPSPHIVGPNITPQPYMTGLPLASMTSVELPHSCTNGGHIDTSTALTPLGGAPPHQWLCDGTLLCLLDSKHSENIMAFQRHWKKGEPVLVAGVDQALDKELWTPQAFDRDFGSEAADLVDCQLGLHLLQLPSRVFWSGFEDMSVRLRDPANDQPRLLKLKDWPPGADFSEKLPRRYNDLMNALPLQQYTRREGCYNMASSLPSFFVKPDLGPKMYNAYGSARFPSCGTTNLHLDISSAVNVMVYCSVPPTEVKREMRLMEEIVAEECCPETLRRVQQSGGKVGAIWHLYSSSDVNKMRSFLKKVYEERGYRLQAGSDPIHDQLVYLDSDLRLRLLREYGVKGWAVAQCVGDAIFIPAGAPHQVRNLCSCIKIAEDFVSPEHVYECLKLTEEFRQLSERHANHEDKLQVKNIIFHSIKDVVGALKTSVK